MRLVCGVWSIAFSFALPPLPPECLFSLEQGDNPGLIEEDTGEK
jgi:hypothetical protein